MRVPGAWHSRVLMVFLLLLPAQGAFAQGFYLIAHMTNSTTAVDWALGQGANAVEIDLQFDAAGSPSMFLHGAPCDCTCLLTNLYGICQATSNTCTMSATPTAMLQHLAGKAGLALIVIDSKIGAADSPAKQQRAGSELIRLLRDNLFSRGYLGKVVVSTAKADGTAYLAAAVAAVNPAAFAPRVYFTIDQENDVVRVLESLITLQTQNRVFAAGSSACAPTQYYDEIALAAKNRTAGVIGLAYNWTIDREVAMETYIARGTNGIMTNDPKTLRELLTRKGIALAGPQSPIAPATSATIIRH